LRYLYIRSLSIFKSCCIVTYTRPAPTSGSLASSHHPSMPILKNVSRIFSQNHLLAASLNTLTSPVPGIRCPSSAASL